MALETRTRRDCADTSARRTPDATQGGAAIYGLGLIGALVWFWQQATGLGEHVVAVLEALVWPAFLVHDAFRAVRG